MSLVEALQEMQSLGYSDSLVGDMLALYREREALHAAEIATALDVDRRTVAKRLDVLLRHRLLRRTRRGYLASPTLLAHIKEG